MGAFKIQTDLDLSGFNLLNFCIQSYTDLENVPNLGLGRKLFFTGNSTDEKNLREVIWNGVEWKAAVYLDDIEALTNGEGSLGTRVKALEDMLGLQDVTDVIDTWNDVKAFFANVDEGLNLMTMLDGKAEWNRDISSDSFKAIGYGNPGTKGWRFNGPALSFGANSTYYAQLQINFQADQIVFRRHTTEGFSDWVSILHEKNYESLIGDTYLKTDGSNIMARNAYIAWNSGADGNDSYDWSAVTGNGLRIISSSAENTGAPTPYATALHVRGRYYFKLASRGGSVDELYYQNSNHDWKTIAFTDSTVEAAHKLVKSTGTVIVTIDDDGTAKFTGEIGAANNIIINPPNGIAWRVAEEKIVNVATGSTGNFVLGNGGAAKGYNTYLDGGTLYFRTYKDGASQTAMTITEEGRVLINRSSATLDRQLSIGSGGVFVSSTLSASPVLGSVGSNSLLVGADAYGMQHWVLGDGQGCIQVGRFDGTATAYALNLNPLGGAVNVGDGGLNVNGTIKSGDKFLLTTTSMNLGSATTPLYVFLARPDANYIWASANGGYINLGVYDSGTTNSANATLSIYSDRVVSGQRNNAVSLGTSNYRWSDVYSVGGNFSGRVLIGGAEDDGTTSLQVGTDIRIGNILATSNRTHISAGTTAYYGRNGGYVLGNAFYDKSGETKLAVAGIYAIDENLNVYAIGLNIASQSPYNRWFDINSTESNFNVLTKFNAGALIPTGQTLTIGSVTIKEVATGEIEVNGNLHTTGTLASGGKATVGEGDNGGGGNANVYSDVLEGVITQEWEVGNPFQKEDVIVSLYMWNTDESRWEMVLADIGVTSENIWVTFGRPTSTTDKYMAVVMG